MALSSFHDVSEATPCPSGVQKAAKSSSVLPSRAAKCLARHRNRPKQDESSLFLGMVIVSSSEIAGLLTIPTDPNAGFSDHQTHGPGPPPAHKAQHTCTCRVRKDRSGQASGLARAKAPGPFWTCPRLGWTLCQLIHGVPTVAVPRGSLFLVTWYIVDPKSCLKQITSGESRDKKDKRSLPS